MSGGEISEALATLAFMALDHGIESVREGGPLIPFAIHDGGDGEAQLTPFVADTLEESEARAREFARENVGEGRVAIAWDGYLTVEGVRADAILVEAQEKGASSSTILAQRYRPGTSTAQFETIGERRPLPSRRPDVVDQATPPSAARPRLRLIRLAVTPDSL